MSDGPAKGDLVEGAFRRHRDEIYRYLLRRTGSHLEAEELTQRVYLDAAEALSKTRPSSVLAWLYVVAERRFIDEVRRHKRTPRMVSFDQSESAPEIADPRQEAGLLYGPATARAIAKALQALSDEDRRVITLHLLEGEPFAVIAKRYGTTEDAAKMRFSRALKKVREILAREGVEP